jgi:hypothetical protein
MAHLGMCKSLKVTLDSCAHSVSARVFASGPDRAVRLSSISHRAANWTSVSSLA